MSQPVANNNSNSVSRCTSITNSCTSAAKSALKQCVKIAVIATPFIAAYAYSQSDDIQPLLGKNTCPVNPTYTPEMTAAGLALGALATEISVLTSFGNKVAKTLIKQCIKIAAVASPFVAAYACSDQSENTAKGLVVAATAAEIAVLVKGIGPVLKETVMIPALVSAPFFAACQYCVNNPQCNDYRNWIAKAGLLAPIAVLIIRMNLAYSAYQRSNQYHQNRASFMSSLDKGVKAVGNLQVAKNDVKRCAQVLSNIANTGEARQDLVDLTQALENGNVDAAWDSRRSLVAEAKHTTKLAVTASRQMKPLEDTKNAMDNLDHALAKFQGILASQEAGVRIRANFDSRNPTLDLSNLGLPKEFPLDILAKMPHLKELNLRGNEITHIPDALSSLNLNSLDVSQNPLRVLGKIRSLVHLDVSETLLTDTDLNVIKDLIHLKDLNARNIPKLKQLDADLFARLTNLETIDISQNELTSLPGIQHLEKLIEVRYSRFTKPKPIMSPHNNVNFIEMMM